MARASAFQAEGRGFESRFPFQDFLVIWLVGGFVKKFSFARTVRIVTIIYM